jgi:hypothetical protein
MAPEAPAGVATNALEVRFTGGMLALNRLLMTLQNKRMPVAGFTLGRDADPEGGMRATILLDCPQETARRYMTLLGSLEDVEQIELAAKPVEVALLKGEAEGIKGSAGRFGVEVHESGGTVVASGEPERLESWLAAIRGDVEDAVRLGPVARPGNGGD